MYISSIYIYLHTAYFDTLTNPNCVVTLSHKTTTKQKIDRLIEKMRAHKKRSIVTKTTTPNTTDKIQSTKSLHSHSRIETIHIKIKEQDRPRPKDTRIIIIIKIC